MNVTDTKLLCLSFVSSEKLLSQVSLANMICSVILEKCKINLFIYSLIHFFYLFNPFTALGARNYAQIIPEKDRKHFEQIVFLQQCYI